MTTRRIPIQMLGQSGCQLHFQSCTVYIDPYLSNSVQELEDQDLKRLLPVTIPPCEIDDAAWVLISHDHTDHCDPHTLSEIANSSPQCRFIGPPPVLKLLTDWGIANNRLAVSHGEYLQLAENLRVRFVPAAHPKISYDNEGRLSAVGYLFDYYGKQIYFAGDTSITQELIDFLLDKGSIDVAFLPVNEPNFFRAKRNVLGNMTIREAFLFAEEVNVKQVVPVHWDMFAINAVYPEEIEIVYRQTKPNFKLILNPSSI